MGLYCNNMASIYFKWSVICPAFHCNMAICYDYCTAYRIDTTGYHSHDIPRYFGKLKGIHRR